MGKRIVSISNGHGEDLIAVHILKELVGMDPEIQVIPFPLVGEGSAYVKAGYEVSVPVRKMPSGGFFYSSKSALWKDLSGGIIGLFFEQLKAVKKMKDEVDGVLAVGDILPLYMAHRFKHPFLFYGSAKSEYQNRASHKPVYSWIERLYLKEKNCRGAYFRDSRTAQRLDRFGIAAKYAGNPMMDAIDEKKVVLTESGAHLIGILPGSREDAIGNLETILMACADLYQKDASLVFAAAITESIREEQLIKLAQYLNMKYEQGPAPYGSHIWDQRSGCRIYFSKELFGDIIHQASVIIGLAGTANEQAAGLGKPIVSFVGSGTQYTQYFAENQKLLLGEVINIVEKNPGAVGNKVIELLRDEKTYKQISLVGRERMGKPGASRVMGEHLLAMVKKSERA